MSEKQVVLARRSAAYWRVTINHDMARLPSDYELAPEWDVCVASIMRPAAQERIKKLLDKGFHKLGDVENRLGYHVGQLGVSS